MTARAAARCCPHYDQISEDEVEVLQRSAMHSLVLGLLSLFLVLGRLPAVSGDCFDEPPNNSSYVNCATCYQTFANALINTADNKYRLSRAFFPISAASPVQVDVSYLRKSDEAEVEKFFWLMGGFYVFQPLDVFIYRSLLFSPPNFRKDYVSVVLPDECFGNDANFSSATELYGFFEYATQRVSEIIPCGTLISCYASY